KPGGPARARVGHELPAIAQPADAAVLSDDSVLERVASPAFGGERRVEGARAVLRVDDRRPAAQLLELLGRVARDALERAHDDPGDARDGGRVIDVIGGELGEEAEALGGLE